MLAIPYSFTAGTTAQSGQVNADFNAVASFVNTYCAILNVANTFTNAVSIISSSGLTLGSGSVASPLVCYGPATIYNSVLVNAASGFSGKLLNLELNGTSVFSVDQAGNASIAGNTTLSGSLQTSAVLISSNTTLGVNHLGRPLICSGTITLTLPAASAYPGGEYNVINAGTGVITLSGTNIGPSALSSVTLSQEGQQVRLASDGTNWWRSAGNYDVTYLVYTSSTSAVSSTPAAVKFPTKLVDLLGEYNSTTGQFTPKESGYYRLIASISTSAVTGVSLSFSTSSSVMGSYTGTEYNEGSASFIQYLTGGVSYYIVAVSGTSTSLSALTGGVANSLTIQRILP